ncbi:HEPN domain-containing protein [Candidatus Pacearchaeota archaeon]|nr:HEPN domain-containing protein [Candidatus Pacearchaeota archaeon]
MNQQQLKENAEQIKICKKWLGTAKSDFEAAKNLYEHENYPQSVFSLQQSIEKTIKAYGIFMGVKESDLKNKFRHDTLKIYEHHLTGFLEKSKSFSETLKAHPELKSIPMLNELDYDDLAIEMSDAKDEFQNIKSSAEDMTKTTRKIESCINKAIKLFENEKISIKGLSKIKLSDRQFNEIKRFMFENLNEISKLKKQELPELKEIEKLTPSYFQRLFSETFSYLIRALSVYSALLYLNLIVYNKVSSTRYPENKTPQQIYNINSPIIKRFRDIQKIHQDCFLKIEDILNEQEKLTKKYQNETTNPTNSQARPPTKSGSL